MSESVAACLSPHLVVGLEGTGLTGRERELLRRIPPAGVILFSRNVRGRGQLRRLTADVVRIVRDVSGYQPLIMADHEGGRISVLAAAIGAPPAQMAIGRAAARAAIGASPAQMAIGRAEEQAVNGRAAAQIFCRRVYRETARRLRECGVNTLLGPVADVNVEYLNPVIGVRAFGEESTEVARLVHDAVEALRGEGIVSCLKHFPGHGSSRADSHLTLPFLPFTLEELREREMEPFVRGIEAGAEMVMVGHVAPRGRFVPASLDAGVISMLREELGFDGVVMTDALEMAGVHSSPGGDARPGGAGDAAAVEPLPIGAVSARAVAAGNDLLVFSRPFGEVVDDLEAGEAGAANTADEDRAAGKISVNELRDFLSGEAATVSRERIKRLRDGPGTESAAASPSGGEPVAISQADGGLEPAAASQADGGLEPAAASQADGAGAEADIYHAVAHHAIRLTGARDAPVPAIEPGRCTLTAVGERKDFANTVVVRFVDKLLGAGEWTGPRSGGETMRPSGGGRDASFSECELRTVLRCEAPGSREPMEIIAVEAGRPLEGAPRIIVLLNRRPLPREDCGRLCTGAALVVVAGWPYAAWFLPPGTPAIVTYGAYDAAADAIGDVIAGRPLKTD